MATPSSISTSTSTSTSTSRGATHKYTFLPTTTTAAAAAAKHREKNAAARSLVLLNLPFLILTTILASFGFFFVFSFFFGPTSIYHSYMLRSVLNRGAQRESYYGSSSMDYCPDYLPLVQHYLAPYHVHPAPLEIEAEARQHLLNSGCVPIKIAQGEIQDMVLGSGRNADFQSNLRTSIALFGSLPDAEVMLCMDDAPTFPKSTFGDHLPRPPFSFCSREDYHDISVPFKVQDPLEERRLINKADALYKSHPWKGRQMRGVWRGTPTGFFEGNTCTKENWQQLPRSKFVNMSLHEPDILDARYAGNSQCPRGLEVELEKAGYGFAPLLHFEDYFDYTMLVDIDGNSWSSRFGELLSTGNAVFKQSSSYYDWFLPLLEPYKHYIPVKNDLSDLVPLMRRYAQEEASGKSKDLKMIGLRGREFARQFLTPSKTLCYLHLLLTEYAQLGAAGGGGGVEEMKGGMPAAAAAAAAAAVKGRKEQQQPGGLLLRRKGP